MKFVLSHDGVLLRLVSGTEKEVELMCKLASATQWNWQTKKNNTFTYQRLYTWVMSGLWKRMLSISKILNTNVEIDGLKDSDGKTGIINTSLTRETLSDWIDSCGFKYEPRWYQFESLYFALKYRMSRCEVATAGGKSFMIFMYCRYLIDHGYVKDGQKILLITIRRMLVTQMVSDFAEYESTAYEKKIVCDTVFSGGKRFTNSNVVVGTYQSLSNMDTEYFDQFAAVVIDECHSAHIRSVKDEIFPKLNAKICKHKFGLSGTQPLPGTFEDLHLEAYIGPTLFKIGAKDLQEENAIAQIKINCIELVYPETECLELYGSSEMQSDKIYESLPFERRYVQYHKKRLDLIKKIVTTFVGNQVILVENVDYAHTLRDLLSENTHKEVSLIFSGTKDAERNAIKASFADGDNKVLVATYETMSTGVSINNIHAVHFPDGGKSRIRIRQSCGRGLRLHPSKEYLTVFDYSDYFKKPKGIEKGPARNRLHAQGIARKKIYNSEQFPIKELKYNI